MSDNRTAEIARRSKIVVWFSCGCASAVGAKKTIEKYGNTHDVVVVNMPIVQEHSDNQRFACDVEKWLGVPIERIFHPKYKGDAVAVWEDRKYMSGVRGAPCTKILKKDLRHIWTEANTPDFHVLGFTADEEKRHRLFVISEIPNVIPVLINEGLSKGDCFRIIQDAGIELPQSYKDGMPNANCDCCVKATSPTYWNLMRVKRPEAFKERAEQSRRLGARLVRYKGKRIFLDELPPDAKGRPIKDMNFECGIFCELPKSKD
jgi:PP-loop superfamily ATP-utilizing enzyme